jgi:hypothetical protein
MDVKVLYTSVNYKSKKILNAIAFDLDETIGSFSDFYSIWSRLEPAMKTQLIFNEIMDLYPEFMRVGILSILRFIQKKQELGQCLPIYIYTNNQCEDTSWIYQLIEYLESRVYLEKVVKLFARPICAFKIKNKIIEPNRTTNEKTYVDFVRCSMLSTSHELCFIDDNYHRKMKHPRVYYIQPPPYVHPLSFKDVIDRFLMSGVYKKLYPSPNNPPTPTHFTCDEPLQRCTSISVPRQSVHRKQGLHMSEKTQSEYDDDEHKISQKIMYYIREFFLISARLKTTKKLRVNIGKFSRKKRHSSL